MRRLPQGAGNSMIDRAIHLHNAEEFGRGIGIALHWIFVLPLKVVWFCLQFLYVCICNIYGVLIVVVMFAALGFIGLVFYLSVIRWVIS